MLQTLFFDVANVEFRYCRYEMLGVVSWRRGGRPLMLDVANINFKLRMLSFDVADM
jgi:hypothetical protein